MIWCFDIEVLNSKMENIVVSYKLDFGNDRYLVLFSCGVMQNVKYYEINDIIVSIIDGYF